MRHILSKCMVGAGFAKGIQFLAVLAIVAATLMGCAHRISAAETSSCEGKRFSLADLLCSRLRAAEPLTASVSVSAETIWLELPPPASTSR